MLMPNEIRVKTDAGWFFVRASVATAPAARPRSRDESDTDELFETARELIDWSVADHSR